MSSWYLRHGLSQLGGIKNIWFHFVLFSHFHVYLKNLNYLVFETVRRDLKNELCLPCPKINAIYYFVVAKIENSKDLKALGKIKYKYKRYHIYFQLSSLIAQLVKNPPAMQETQVWVLGPKDPQEKG